MKKVEWLPIPGYIGRYAASSAGEIMSMDYRRTGLPGILLPKTNKYGYLSVQLYNNKKVYHKTVHRLVALAFLGESRNTVNHINGVKTDNRIENLEYCGIGDNIRKGHLIGLYDNVRGENSGNAKLTEEKVREIRRLLSLGFSQYEIATMVGTAQSNISLIKNGKTWAHVAPNGE